MQTRIESTYPVIPYLIPPTESPFFTAAIFIQAIWHDEGTAVHE
jgi:hypothetical protein